MKQSGVPTTSMVETWEAGRSLVVRYGRNGQARWVVTGQVLEDDGENVTLWVPPGSPVIYRVPRDGRRLRDIPRLEAAAIPAPASHQPLIRCFERRRIPLQVRARLQVRRPAAGPGCGRVSNEATALHHRPAPAAVPDSWGTWDS